MKRRKRRRLVISVATFLAVVAHAAPASGAEPAEVDRRQQRSLEELPLVESPEPEEALPEVPEGRFTPAGPRAEPERVTELVAQRTATSEVWVNSDGSRSVTEYAIPQYFQSPGSEAWVPIESEIVVDGSRAGRVRSKANSWEVSFGPAGAVDGMQQVEVDGKVIGFVPVDADSSVQPVAKDSTATYTELWPATDAVYAVSATGTDERLVLKSAKAPTSFSFDVLGATPRVNRDGGIDLFFDGSVAAFIPPLTVETSNGMLEPKEAGAAFSLDRDEAG